MWKKIFNILKHPLFILFLILIIGLILRLINIDRTSFWYDEAFTGDILKLSWKDMFAVIAADKVHPPLFYVLIRTWSIIFGITQFSLRSFSVFFGLCGIGLSYFVGKELFKKESYPVTGLVLALVVAISPFFVSYSVEARAYSFLAFLALGLAYSVYKLLNSIKGKERTKYLIATLLLAVVLCGTHYLQVVYVIAIVCAGLIYKFVFTEKGLNKRWLYVFLGIVLAVALAVIFLPLKSFVSNLGISGMWWVPDIKLYEVVRVYYSYFLGVVRYMDGVPPVRELIFSIPTLVFGGVMFGLHLIGYVLTLVSKKIVLEEKRKISFFFSLALITFLGFYLLGVLNFNCFVERYTIAGGILLLISFWMIMSSLIKKWFILIPIGIYIAFLFMLKPMPTRTDYREVAKALDDMNNVQRYVFTSPTDLIDSQFYMSHTNVYYSYELKGEYPGWALLNDDVNGIDIKDVKEGDILVVPNTEIDKYINLGYSISETFYDGRFSILTK
ncbi:glycosyltransferase family 39 protein [Patescibacteria group bacterium]|nr:glycosyltransferase family 39 protein [Patescibacteria group bacterium]